MKETGDLHGAVILILEDDYYLATDAARALSKSGAHVLGPYAQEPDAVAQLAQTEIHAAVVDINLGAGATFELAQRLKARGIPFLFATGYDQASVPETFSDTPRLLKPVTSADLVQALVQIVGRPAATR